MPAGRSRLGSLGMAQNEQEGLTKGSQQKERVDLCDIALGICLMISAYMKSIKCSYVELKKLKKMKHIAMLFHLAAWHWFYTVLLYCKYCVWSLPSSCFKSK